MAYYSMDPDGLLGYITGMEAWAAQADTERTQVRDANLNTEDEPAVAGVDSLMSDWSVVVPYAPGAPPGFSVLGWGVDASKTLAGCVTSLMEAAHDLRTRRQEAIDMNEDGVTITTPEGRVCYYLPDGAADTVENVVSYNSQSVARAERHAQDLQQALEDGTTSDGRTLEEVLAGMARQQDIPTYGAALVKAVGGKDGDGAQGYLELVYMLSDRYGSQPGGEEAFSEASQILGHVLAAASQDEVGGGELGNQVGTAVAEDAGRGSAGLSAALNALLTVPGVGYGTVFLVNAADHLEDVDPTTMPSPSVAFAGGVPSTPTDPLAGVLTAMGSNPEAAVAYLVPDSSKDAEGGWAPGRKSQERWRLLSGREWPEAGLEGLSSALATASSLRNPSQADRYADLPSAQERATWAAAQGIVLLDGHTGSFTPTTEANIGAMLGSCGPEVVGVANKRGVNQGDDPYMLVPITVGGGDKKTFENAVAHLLYEVCDNEDAAFSIAQGTTAYTAERASTHATTTQGDPLSAITRVYDQQANVLNLLTKLGQDQADDAQRQANAVYNGAVAATTLLSLVPGAPGAAATVVGTGMAAVGSPQVSTGSTSVTGAREALLGAAYTNAFNAGLITNPPDPATTSWYSQDSHGNGQVVLETEQQVEDFRAWMDNGAGDSDQVVKDFNNIGSSSSVAPWGSADEFKEKYGEDW